MRITQESIERPAVRLEAVAPVVVPHDPARLLDMGIQPRKHDLERRRLLEIAIDPGLSFREGLVKRLCNPAMPFVYLAADDDRVHDREDFRLAEVVALDPDEVLEQPLHMT